MCQSCRAVGSDVTLLAAHQQPSLKPSVISAPPPHHSLVPRPPHSHQPSSFPVRKNLVKYDCLPVPRKDPTSVHSPTHLVRILRTHTSFLRCDSPQTQQTCAVAKSPHSEAIGYPVCYCPPSPLPLLHPLTSSLAQTEPTRHLPCCRILERNDFLRPLWV